ncbi:hypothetical protein MKX08_001405 [Trichoderma sp. CBMAI-0020]|nr:hypothetical protein MKX08_001405 [Trichoderma sp. CBMAI-0020]
MAMLGTSSRSSISSNLVTESTMTDIVPRRAPSFRADTSLTDNNWTVTDFSMLEEEETNPLHSHWEAAVAQKPRDSLRGADRLVQDLLLARARLEEEKEKVARKDAEIAKLHEKLAVTKEQQVERMSALPALDEEVNELRRLLEFHKSNGERVSRQCQDLQATNKDLQVSLQATEKILEEQTALISGLGLQPNRRKF